MSGGLPPSAASCAQSCLSRYLSNTRLHSKGPPRTGHDVSNRLLLHVVREGNLLSFAPHSIQTFQNNFYRQLVACPEFLTPLVKDDMVEETRASAPPWEPTPSCRIAAVKAVSPSLNASHRLEISTEIPPSGYVELFFEVHFTLVVRDAHFGDVASLGDRIHSSSSSRKRHSSGTSPVAHLTVRMSRILKSRLRCPAPAKAMMASRCSCR